MYQKYQWFKGIIVVMAIWLGAATLLNQYLALHMVRMLTVPKAQALELTGDPAVDAQLLVFPQGTPEIYGTELGITYPDPRDTRHMEQMLSILEDYDRGQRKITLTGDNLQRYIRLGTIPTIACEFCCSVKTLIFNDGRPACACAHSAAMRGLMMYLILNHGDEYTDELILNEVMKWKAITFPKQMMQRYIEESQTGEFTPDISALLVGTRVSEDAVINAPSPLDVSTLPSMAGGC